MMGVEKSGIGKAEIGLGVSIAMLLISLISNAWLYTQTTDLQTEVNTLKSEYDAYVATHSHSDSEYVELLTNYTQLQQNYQTLATEYESLTESYNNLTEEQQTLEENYNQLQLAYHQLNTTYHDLKSENEQLETTYQTLVAVYNSYKEAYSQLISVVNLHVKHPSQNEKLLTTPGDPAVESKVEEITGGWSNSTDWTEYWIDVKKMYAWVVNNIEYRYDGLYPVLPQHPSGPVTQSGEMWQFPNQTLDLRKGDCDDMAILLCSMIYCYGNMEQSVECIAITQHMAVYIPVASDEICILDPSGRYYTGYPFQITSKNISEEVHHWLDYWRDSIGYPKVDWIFSAYIWKAFWDTEIFINWLYDRWQN